ncbi:MAG: hypothetical protein J6K17_07420 [Oscillospiraceae bacterium]|nr:hypothetical protein [Oscillospiraceae bacterium]
MKKFLPAVAALAVCTVLTACGGAENTSDTAATTVSSVSETTSAETVSADTAVEKTTETTADAPAATEITSSAASETSVIEETTIPEEITSAEETEPEDDAPVSDEEIEIDDSIEAEPVSSSFDTMEDFLGADIFALEGETKTADNCLSSSVISAFDGNFCFEKSDFDGGNPIKLAVKDKMVMFEQEIDGRTDRMVIRDSKVYSFDHENKVALFFPADNELVSHYSAEGMEILPENIGKESFVVADVTIGGKAYKFEYGTTTDWAMLYTSDGKLYASVESGDSLEYSLCKFSVTSKIPDDAFDIPDDYFQLDMEEMMQNMPPPEEAE